MNRPQVVRQGQRFPFLLVVSLCFLPRVATAQTESAALVGTVIDAGSGAPIPHATVAVLGTERSTATDSLGTYALRGVRGRTLVHVFADGYAGVVVTVEVPLTGTQEMRFGLESLRNMLGSVGRRGDQGASGGVSVARSSNRTDPLAARLDGEVPGVNLRRQDASLANGGNDIVLRGIKTILGRQDPVIVIDGVRQMSVAFRDLASVVDFSLITEIEVIRGAAAAARFGGDTAGGVILITTRK